MTPMPYTTTYRQLGPNAPGGNVIPQYAFDLPGRPPGVLATGYDPTTDEGKVAVYNAIQRADEKGQVMGGSEVAVVNVVMHPWERTDQASGEVRRAVRSVIVREDDSSIAFVSDGVASSLMQLAAMYGPPPWYPPIKVRIIYERLSSGNQWCWLKLLGRS